MNYKKYFVCFMPLILAGCLSTRNTVVLDEVGPPRHEHQNSGNGTLIVYSAYDSTSNDWESDAYGRWYTNYSIANKDGSDSRKIKNTTPEDEPEEVSLLPGQYIVRAEANGYGTVTVPVRVEAGGTTVIHLEGSYSWPGEVPSGSAAVKLPDGEVIGWKSGDEAQVDSSPSR